LHQSVPILASLSICDENPFSCGNSASLSIMIVPAQERKTAGFMQLSLHRVTLKILGFWSVAIIENLGLRRPENEQERKIQKVRFGD
jgi:hypothetical protein